ncbi:hypothetical protein [Streptomyces luteireticuli]
MTAALADAAHRLDVTVSGPPSWGWMGRTVGSRAGTACWLRVASSMKGRTLELVPGEGAAGAQERVPEDVPRPRLHDILTWTTGPYTYIAELSDHAMVPVVSPGRCDLTEDPGLPEQWWDDLFRALGALAMTGAGVRATVTDVWVRRAFPHFLGIPAPDSVSRVTGHGDLQWANLTQAPLTLLDWERWGRVPVGFDAGLLHVCSLAVPTVAEQVLDVFGDILGTEAGRVGELCAIAEMRQAVARGSYRDLAKPLHARAEALTGVRPPDTPSPELPPLA